MKSILTIIKSPLIWRVMISCTVFLLLRELKAMHKEIIRVNHNQTLFNQGQGEVLLASKQQKQIMAQLRDSVSWVQQPVYFSSESNRQPDTHRYKVFSYHDEFYDVSGISNSGQQLVSISSRDTMTQVVYQKRKTPWLWIFSLKVLEQRVYFKNPDAHIHYSRTINIVK